MYVPRCTKPIPGQEQANAVYLVGIGAAGEVKNAAEMKKQLLEVIANQSVLLKLKKNAQRSHRQPDVLRTVDAILETEHHYLPVQDGLQFSYANI